MIFIFRKMWLMLIVNYVTLFHCLYVTMFVGKLTVLRNLFQSWKVLTVEEPFLGFHFYVIGIKWWMFWRRVGTGPERRLTPQFHTAPGQLLTVWTRLRPPAHIRDVLLYSATTTKNVQASWLEMQMTFNLSGMGCLRRTESNLIYFWFPPHWKSDESFKSVN